MEDRHSAKSFKGVRIQACGVGEDENSSAASTDVTEVLRSRSDPLSR